MVVDYGRYHNIIKWQGDAVYNEATGNWVQGIDKGETICRATPAGRRKYMLDGVNIDYSFDIAFPFPSGSLPKKGDTITIIGTQGNEIFKGTLIDIYVGSYSIRAWA